jgi:lipopolysaccharide export system protein LptA
VKQLPLLVSILAGLFCSAAGWALPEDEEQPIHIVSREIIRDETAGLTVYRGAVVMRQGTLRIEADEITMHQDGRSDIERVVASGAPAKLQQQLTEGSETVYAMANHIEYRRRRALVELSEQASLTRGQSVLSAATIRYSINREVLRAFSAAGGGPRVTTIIYPTDLERTDADDVPTR